MKQQIIRIRRRNGRLAKFNQEKITTAIYQAVTAVSEEDGKLSQKLSNQVVKIINRRFREKVLTVEDVQNIVEEVLIRADLTEIAKAYILYREQRRKIRESIKVTNESLGMVDQYLKEVDWEVKENANMTYSLQGLNNYISNGVTKRYWLEKVYPLEIREAAEKGDFHIHDLGILSPYCVGWNLQDLLLKGFTGVSGKISSKPAKHFRSALGQLINFFYTLQGEAAGAIAVSSFDTLLAPFIRYDKLNYKQVKQAIQEFMFNCNVPTRVGFQCMSEDTEILTKNGWKNYRQVKKGSIIATFNIEKGFIEYLSVNNVFTKKYKGIMYNLKNRISDQLISPEHRVVRKMFNSESYTLEKIEKILSLKSPFMVPVGSEGNILGNDQLNENIVKLIAWLIAEGTIDKSGRGSGRISIYQSKEKNSEGYKEIISLCRNLNLKYTERIQKGLGADCNVIRFDANSTRKILKYFNSSKNKGIKFIPDSILNSDVETSRLFLETYIKGDGHEGCKITTTEEAIKDGLLQVTVNAGYGATVLVRKPDNDLSKKDRYIIRLIKHKDTYINKVKKVNYQGIIWCPNTDNETVVAKRNGKIFITGNTPFTNVTLDLIPPKSLAELPVIIGGKSQKEKYGDFQKEINLFNKAFYEIIIQGDANQRVFTFPIPTINITKNFDWDNPNHEPIWEATAKYGINYFSNFINSELDPDDIRSMCPISGLEKVLIKSSRGRQLEYSSIGHIYEGNVRNKKSKGIYEIYSDGKFIEGKFNKFSNQKMIKVILSNGHEVEMTTEHLNYVIESNNSNIIKILKGKELKKEMYLPYSLKVYQGGGGNRELGYFIGAYAGDGSFDGETTVVFSLENERKKQVVIRLQKIAEKYFGAHYSTRADKNTKLFTLKIHSRAAVGLCKDFVAEKERNKHYRARLFGTSIEFRKGVVAGHYATDGGNRNRIYTSSKKMVETLNMLAATLGTTTSIYKDDRLGRLGKEPNYAVLFYQLNRKKYGDFWFKYDNKLWVKIDSIKPIAKTTAYCFEVKNNEPMFTVGTTGILTHNCRLRLNNKELYHRGGGLFGSAPLTGSVGVVTINMPRIGYLSKNEKEFFERLGNLMDLAKESLEIKRKTLEAFTEKNLYPYSKFYLSEIKKMRGTYWANHFSTIGLIGMNEALMNFMEEKIFSDKGIEFTKKVLDFMRKKLVEYQKETGNIYNLEATPAEGTSYRLAKQDKDLYPKIITAGKDTPYYTNSTQLPVDYTEDMFEALEKQDELQIRYTGGTVFHSFLGEKIYDTEVVKNLIKKIFTKFKLPYFTLTPTFSICPNHGYLSGEHFKCPECGEDAEVYSRVVGYLRPIKQWNKGKQEEYKQRKDFVVKKNR